MKKNYLWLTALLVTLAFVFPACGGGDDPVVDGDPVDINLEEAFSVSPTSQDKATVTVNGGNAVFAHKTGTELWGELIAKNDNEGTFWDASAYKGIKFEYKATGKATIFMQDDNTIYIYCYAGDGWGAVPPVTEWTSITLPFSLFKYPDSNNTDVWFGAKKPMNPGAILKMAFQIDGVISGDKFELRNFQAY